MADGVIIIKINPPDFPGAAIDDGPSLGVVSNSDENTKTKVCKLVGVEADYLDLKVAVMVPKVGCCGLHRKFSEGYEVCYNEPGNVPQKLVDVKKIASAQTMFLIVKILK